MTTLKSVSVSTSWPLKVLTRAEVERFLEIGYVKLPAAFPREAAAAIRQTLWGMMKLDEHAEKWDTHIIHLTETIKGPQADACYPPRVTDAFDDLVGAGRWDHPHGVGWWPVIFPGFDAAPWKAPEKGWHVDGQHFHHHLISREQGLLAIFLFSDMGPGDGGTAFDVGSHRIAARELAASEPVGLSSTEVCVKVNQHPRAHVSQIVGQAGDVFLLHPFMNHSISANVGQRVRFICNVCLPLHEPMVLDRADPAQTSPVECAIVRALADGG